MGKKVEMWIVGGRKEKLEARTKAVKRPESEASILPFILSRCLSNLFTHCLILCRRNTCVIERVEKQTENNNNQRNKGEGIIGVK